MIFAVGVLRETLQEFLVELDADAHRRERNLAAVLLDQVDTRGLFVSLAVGQHQHAVEPVGTQIFLDLVDRRLHSKGHLRATADFEQVDIVNRPFDRGLVACGFGRDQYLGLVRERDYRNLVVRRQVVGQELYRLDNEFQAPLVVHRARAIYYNAKIERQPATTASATLAAGDCLEQDVEYEVFCTGEHMFAARQRLEAKRIGHSSISRD